MKFLILLIASLFFFTVNITFANNTNVPLQRQYEARLVLKKWGLSYCLKKYSKIDPNLAYSSSMESYFQNGLHTDEAAYTAIRAYFDTAIATDLRVGKMDSSQSLTKCLDAYENKKYNLLVIQQDSFISIE